MSTTSAPRTEWRQGATEVRIESDVDLRTADRLWQLYLTAFTPLQEQAAALHVLSREEFDADLADPRISTYVAYQDGEPLGLTAMTNELSAVPWVSPDFYAARHPEAAARNAIYYILYACTDTSRARVGVLWLMFQAFCEIVEQRAGVLGYDICTANNQMIDFARRLEIWHRRLGAREVQHLDSQHFYAANYGPDRPMVVERSLTPSDRRS